MRRRSICYSGGPFDVVGVNFNGSTWTRRTSNLTGIADADSGALSYWLRIIEMPDYIDHDIFSLNGNISIRLGVGGVNGARTTITLKNKGFVSATNLGFVWNHVAVSWSPATGIDLYIESVPTDSKSFASGVMDYTDNPISFGAGVSGTEPRKFDMAEFWFAPFFVDFSDAAVLQKFRSTSGKPVNLGPNGSKPTGSQPAIYLRGGAANFLTNLGYGGDFTVAAGTLGDSATSPSD